MGAGDRVNETWAVQPWHVRFFILYLSVVVCVLIVRSMRLTWRLYSFSKRQRISLRDIRDGIITPELFAESALANRVFCNVPSDHDPETPSPVEAETAFLRMVQAAEDRFQYLWDVWSVTYNSANITGTQALIKTGFRLLDRLAHGLLVCTALYGTAILFEGALMRRRNSWRRICLTSTNTSVS